LGSAVTIPMQICLGSIGIVVSDVITVWVSSKFRSSLVSLLCQALQHDGASPICSCNITPVQKILDHFMWLGILVPARGDDVELRLLYLSCEK
jgi:hypothetical protein